MAPLITIADVGKTDRTASGGAVEALSSVSLEIDPRDSTIHSTLKGVPAKAVYTYAREPITRIVSLKSSGITKLEQVKGVKIGVMSMADGSVYVLRHAITKATVFGLANPEAAIRNHWKMYPATKPQGTDEKKVMQDSLRIFTSRFELFRLRPASRSGARASRTSGRS